MQFILFFLSFVLNSNASEKMSKGDVLKQDSIVFTIDEAEALRKKILELEEKERKLKIYEELYSLENKKYNLCNESVDLYKIKEQNYSSMIDNYQLIIKEKDKQLKINKYENTGYFILGATVVVGSFYMTSSILDSAR